MKKNKRVIALIMVVLLFCSTFMTDINVMAEEYDAKTETQINEENSTKAEFLQVEIFRFISEQTVPMFRREATVPQIQKMRQLRIVTLRLKRQKRIRTIFRQNKKNR